MLAALLRWTLPACLTAVALVVAVFLGEGLARMVVNPVDYLQVHPVFDSVLGARLRPHAGGHDEWGFRNPQVPEQADIVTIGDSQTYGVGASTPLSWPAQLGTLTGRRVYNAALGGYSPVQYDELLRSRAIPLRPAVVIVGFYYGNDLWEAHQTVYGLRHWKALRRPELAGMKRPGHNVLQADRFLGPARDWLARHSVVYRLGTASVAGVLARRLELGVQEQARRDVLPFRHPDSGARTAFTPLYRLRALNLDSANVQEGLRLSLDRLEHMARRSAAAGIGLLVVLIPTKERVFQPWIETDSSLNGHAALRSLLRHENDANRRIQQFLRARGVAYLDLAEPLRQAAQREAIYPADADGHPNAAGYAVFAQAVARVIEAADSGPAPR